MSKQLSKDENFSREVTKYQKYEKITIPRSEIKNASYNPRRISDKARKELKNKIKKVGLVNAPVWNKRTGNLISGHQRLALIDNLEHSRDYLITVDAVDVDLKTEKELNVFLNNTSAMGEWDLPVLENLLTDQDIDINELGFDAVDLDYLLGNGVFNSSQNLAIQKDIDKLNEIKETRKKLKKITTAIDEESFYTVLVFQSSAEVERFMLALGYPADEQYLNGHLVAEKLNINLTPCIEKMEAAS